MPKNILTGRLGALGSVVLIAGLLSGCSVFDRGRAGASLPADPGSDYKVGRPYQINDIWYTPEEDFSYLEEGVASWYGAQFNGRSTANGEIFDMNKMTAAHRTLPLPSVVRVTNLGNSRNVVLRVNDRGPFAGGRIIDVSRAAADALGFRRQGVARVRVEIMSQASQDLKYGGAAPDLAPLSRPASRTVASLPPPLTPSPVPRPTPPLIPVTARPAPVGSATGDSNIYIQTGAFLDYDNALAARNNLRTVGVNVARIDEAMVEGRRFYRVRIGPLGDMHQAETMLEDRIGAAAPEARIVID